MQLFYRDSCHDPPPRLCVTARQVLMDAETVRHFAALVRTHGTDCWWSMSTEQLLPPRHRAEAERWTRGRDTLDVWFDSGASWASLLPGDGSADSLSSKRRADVFLEGSDQHRGWFLSSLLTASAVLGHPPYRLPAQRRNRPHLPKQFRH